MPIEPPSAATRARHQQIAQEIHLDPFLPLTLALFAPPPGRIETEPPRPEPQRLGQPRGGEHLTDLVHHARVRRGTRPRVAADRRLIDHDHLVQLRRPGDRFERPRRRRFQSQLRRQRRLQRVDDEGTLPAARHAADPDQRRQRNRRGDVLQVVRLHPADRQHLLRSTTLSRIEHPPPARQVISGETVGLRFDLPRRRVGDQPPAVPARAGADVDQPVRRADRRLVVFDDHDRVAGPPQVVDALDQPVVVGRVQSDRRLIQHVTDADQPAADVGRQPDALQFAAGERFGPPVQRQVIDAHADQITQPPRDLGRDRCGDSRLQRRQFPRQGFTPRRRLVDRHRDQFRDGPPADRHRPRLRPQPRAVARGADGRTTAGRLPPVGGEPDQPDPVARPARPVRAVVTERPRLDLLERLAAIHARHRRRKDFFTRFAVRGFDHRGQQPVGHLQSRVDRRGQPRPAAIVLDLQPVHDGVDRMQFPDGQRRHVFDQRHHPVDADPDQP